jgi:hypothetical protein
MLRVETNIGDFVKDQLSILDDLRNVDKILREAALNTVVIISNRVQNRGERTDGAKMASQRREGAYSEDYGRRRNKRGRQTDIIDLTSTDQGGMMDSFTVEPEGETGYVVGFAGQRAADLAEYNEQRFGTIFELSDSEAELIESIIDKRIDEAFR